MQFGMRVKDMFNGFDPEQYQKSWFELGGKIKAALPLDPASDQALEFVREWLGLLEPFTRVATKEMWESSRNMYSNMDKWQGQANPGFDKTVWDFIQEASQVHRAAGHDIGPVPAWIQQG